ncbi:MAG TPA: hypothetical protein VJX67_22150, partial [Blastocatellia bacterium]|nr:hypothetical protein [Blastocatellia bacterium]
IDAGETSQPSPSPIQIQAAPATIGGVACASHIYECGQALSFLGAVPGAMIEVSVAGQVRGQRVSSDGTAKISLSTPSRSTDTLTVTQTACGRTGPAVALPQPDSPPLTAQGLLPAPLISGPVYACQQGISIAGVVDGALVSLIETPGSTTEGLFATSTEMLLTKQLGSGGSISVMQTMPVGCQIQGTVSQELPINPTVPPPTILGPLFAGDVYVGLANLIPGARIELLQGDVSLGTGTCSSSSQYFAVPGLIRKQFIEATQSLCSNTSARSHRVRVKPAAVPGQPAVQAKLFQCGQSVGVSNLTPGALVSVYSAILGAPIGLAYATGTQMDIRIAPLLAVGDQIYAVQERAGRFSPRSVPAAVEPLPNQGAPAVVAPVGAGSSSVFVQNLVAGARVDVYVNDVFRGTATATGLGVEVQLSPPLLNIGDLVSVRESTCQGMLSGVTVPVTGCECVQISKVPLSGGTFLYTFNCQTPANTVETVQVTASSDAEALQIAELGCDRQYGV